MYEHDDVGASNFGLARWAAGRGWRRKCAGWWGGGRQWGHILGFKETCGRRSNDHRRGLSLRCDGKHHGGVWGK